MAIPQRGGLKNRACEGGDFFHSRMRNVVFELLVFVLFNGTLAQNSTRPTVDVGYVIYLGNQTYPNTVAYLGIPYAEPPVGDLRFRATVPLNTTRVREEANLNGEVVVNATYYPDFCIQGTTGGMCDFLPKILSDTGAAGDAGGAGSENCLNVNVYTPYGAREGDNRTFYCRRPVLRVHLSHHSN
jgi:hypothetical protein